MIVVVIDVYPSFNPRTHVGCDKLDRKEFFAVIVSIHAPT